VKAYGLNYPGGGPLEGMSKRLENHWGSATLGKQGKIRQMTDHESNGTGKGLYAENGGLGMNFLITHREQGQCAFHSGKRR